MGTNGRVMSRVDAGCAHRSGTGRSFGTFGELLQGMDDERVEFLVTFPIDVWTTATFTSAPGTGGVVVDPPHKVKAWRLATEMLATFGCLCGGRLELDSRIPEGKGLASSSADLVATARALARAFDLAVPPDLIEDLIRDIEPTDGVMYDDVVVYEHRAVRLRTPLPALAGITIVGLDEGGMVDTVAANQGEKHFGRAQRREYTMLLADLRGAVAAGDLRSVGRIATRSAELNQVFRPKRTLEALIRACADVDGLGVVAAHSGTVLGLLVADDDADHSAKVAAAVEVCTGLTGDATVRRSVDFRGSRVKQA
jgi:L-threonine kinase